jgi:hypothetical protein
LTDVLEDLGWPKVQLAATGSEAGKEEKHRGEHRPSPGVA